MVLNKYNWYLTIQFYTKQQVQLIQYIVRVFCTIYNEQSVFICELLLIGTCIINDKQ